jgi:hypothetical protein
MQAGRESNYAHAHYSLTEQYSCLTDIIFIAFVSPVMHVRTIPVAAHSRGFRPSLAGFTSSNPSEGKDICLLRVLCVVR